jgi:hypothetical protein
MQRDALGTFVTHFRFLIYEGAMPEFEREEAPELARIVAASEMVFLHDRSHGVDVQQAARICALVCQRVIQHVFEFAFEPLIERYAEPFFLTVDNDFGNDAFDGLFQNVFRFLPAQLERAGDSLHKFDQLVVEKRRTRLDGIRHAHPVNLGHDVAGQISFAVEIHQPINAQR